MIKIFQNNGPDYLDELEGRSIYAKNQEALDKGMGPACAALKTGTFMTSGILTVKDRFFILSS
jgi:hypothetical protein